MHVTLEYIMLTSFICGSIYSAESSVVAKPHRIVIQAHNGSHEQQLLHAISTIRLREPIPLEEGETNNTWMEKHPISLCITPEERNIAQEVWNNLRIVRDVQGIIVSYLKVFLPTIIIKEFNQREYVRCLLKEPTVQPGLLCLVEKKSLANKVNAMHPPCGNYSCECNLPMQISRSVITSNIYRCSLVPEENKQSSSNKSRIELVGNTYDIVDESAVQHGGLTTHVRVHPSGKAIDATTYDHTAYVLEKIFNE